MIREFLAKNFSYQLQDFLNRTSVLKTMDFLNQSQYWDRDKILDYQFEKFLKLLHHSSSKVPYYRELFKQQKLDPKDLKDPGDISRIPILTKHAVREHYQALMADDLDTKKVITVASGGTTGPPLKVLRDRQDTSFTWGAFFRWYNWMGIEPGDRITKIWGTPTVLHKPFMKYLWAGVKDYYYNRQHIDSFRLNQVSIPAVLDRINKFEPVLIRGYLSAFIQLAEYIREKDITGIHRANAISSTTETLLPPLKNLVEKSFQAPLYDQYGCGECNSIAFDRNDGNGLYIAMEHALIEILDNQNEDAGYKEGRVIMTNLDNFAMPFIRYENGDMASRGRKEFESDIQLDVLKRISGRTADTIVLKDGSKVHGVFFTDILNDLFNSFPDFVHRFQVYQNTPGKIDFRIESKQPLPGSYSEQIYEALNRFFDEVCLTHLPELSSEETGKFRYILSDLP